MLQVSISRKDDSVEDLEDISDSFYHRMLALRNAGRTGKQIIHELLSDDLGAPPKWVRISGTLADGTEVSDSIPYR